MKTQKLVRELNERQLACEVVPIELLEPGRWQALLIPAAERWPKALFEKLDELSQNGCGIAFIDQTPTGYADCGGAPEVKYGCVGLKAAAGWCLEHVRPSVTPERYCPMVHVYPYDSENGRLYLIFNEDSRREARFEAAFEGLTSPVLYDPEEDRCVLPQGVLQENGYKLAVTLEPGQLLVLADPLPGWPEAGPKKEYRTSAALSPLWRVSFPDAPDMDGFETDAPEDLFKRYPRFAGTARYEAEIYLNGPAPGFEVTDLHGAAALYIDGKKINERVSGPYRFTADIPAGRHTLRLELVNCPGYRWRDPLSAHGWLPPVGLTGKVCLLEEL